MNEWSTSSEINFIRGLGTHCDPKGCQPNRKLKLLLGYKEGIGYRKVWDDISRPAVEAEVATQITKMNALLAVSSPVFKSK